jgi:hypothetical protein
MVQCTDADPANIRLHSSIKLLKDFCSKRRRNQQAIPTSATVAVVDEVEVQVKHAALKRTAVAPVTHDSPMDGPLQIKLRDSF